MPPSPVASSPPADRVVRVDGRAVYLRERPGNGPAVVFLPGGALDTVDLTWAEVFDRLPAAWRLLLPDLPGYGLSAPLPGDATRDYVRWLGRFVDAVGLERFVLAGSSKGGAVALAYALRERGRVAGLVLSGPYGVQARVPFHPLVAALVRVPAVARAARTLLRRRSVLAAFFRLVALGPRSPLTPDLVDDALEGVAPPHALDAFARWMRDEIRPDGCRTNLVGALPALDTPTLLLAGRHDRTFPLARARAVAAALPVARLVETDAGHLPPRERPDEVAAAVEAFVPLLDV